MYLLLVVPSDFWPYRVQISFDKVRLYPDVLDIDQFGVSEALKLTSQVPGPKCFSSHRRVYLHRHLRKRAMKLPSRAVLGAPL